MLFKTHNKMQRCVHNSLSTLQTNIRSPSYFNNQYFLSCLSSFNFHLPLIPTKKLSFANCNQYRLSSICNLGSNNSESKSLMTSEEEALLNGLIAGERGCLARVITLVESTNLKKRKSGQLLLNNALAYIRQNSTEATTENKLNGNFGRRMVPIGNQNLRIGISGPPGAGKSTFIEAFGSRLTGGQDWAPSNGLDYTKSIKSKSTESRIRDTSAPSRQLHQSLSDEQKRVQQVVQNTEKRLNSEYRRIRDTLRDLTHRLAVLAIDPSSSTTHGSLLADKTRMPKLANDENAFVRPSPAGGHLGGVARASHEAMVLCEAAGYNIILMETVGVGQSEFAVADMTDMFVLLLPPAGGDELQGLKRGIVEMADFVIINKADGDLLPAARRSAMEYTSALKFMRRRRSNWQPKVLLVSSLTGEGLEEFWHLTLDFYTDQKMSGNFEENRQKQMKTWMWNYLREGVINRFYKSSSVQTELSKIEEQVVNGYMAPGPAAEHLLDIFSKS